MGRITRMARRKTKNSQENQVDKKTEVDNKIHINDDPDALEFVVEKIIAKRVVSKKVEYLIEWMGYGPEENSWEPESNLDCPKLIEEYENSIKDKDPVKLLQEVDKKLIPAPKPKVPKGFDRGLKPDYIVAATVENQKILYLMKWKGSEMADLVPAVQANYKCPEIVIKFHEERGLWRPLCDLDDDEACDAAEAEYILKSKKFNFD